VAAAQTAVSASSQMPLPSLGMVNTPDPYHELETKYIFGFTEGADIGAEGEKSIEFETTTASGLRGGRYAALEQEVEFESVPTQNFGYELSAHGLGFSVNDVPGMPNAHGANFSGLSAEFRYLVIGRGSGSPFGLTLVAEPEWARIDDGGQPVTDFNLTLRGILDTELIPNRLYAATNVFYTPDYARSPGESWAWSAEYGVSGALAYRFTPKLTMGAEIEYDTAYDGTGVQSFQGQALYLGPTFHYQFNGHAGGGLVDPDRPPC
jgi:Putative MetA-pathway of phenol degradation